MGAGLNNWIYIPNELASHIPGNYFVRLKNFDYTPTNTLTSRKGLEPVKYFINKKDPDNELNEVQGLVAPTYEYDIQEDQDYFLNNIGTHTLALLGDSLVFTGVNASSFHIIPFSLTALSESKHYEYIATNANGEQVQGDNRGGYHVYLGKPIFWNGKGTYQTYANTISEEGFTKLDNSILPLEDQTIIAACTFESRLVVATLQGYLMWTQPQWNGTDRWYDVVSTSTTTYLQIVDDPGEVIEFVKTTRGGLVVSTRNSANVSGRILNIPTLVADSLQVIDTGVDSFFARNSSIASNDQMVGISPQGVLSVKYDSLAQGMQAEYSNTAPIIEYLSEIFYDNVVYPYLDAFLDTKSRKGYFIHDWSINGERKAKILVLDFNSTKWSLFETELPIQKIFLMYDHLCAAGWVRENNKLVLGIWSFSELYQDVKIFPISKVIENNTYWFWEQEESKDYTKSFTTGVMNVYKNGPNEVPGSGSLPRQLLFSSDDVMTYKIAQRYFTKDAWGNSLEEAEEYQVEDPIDDEKWSSGTHNPNGRWNTLTRKNHYLPVRYTIPTANMDMYFQLLFETNSAGKITIHSMMGDPGGKA